LLNGEPIALKQPTAQDEIGLTDREARLLNELAAEYSSEGLAISLGQQRLRWERLMRITASEEVPVSLSEQLEALSNRRSTMVLEYVRRLEAMFGEARFRTLNDWILSRAKAGWYFPFPVDGNVQASKLIRQPVPVYPPLARQARIQGVVRFNAIINKDGTIQYLKLVTGDPLLVPSAQEAVTQWVYEPTLVNGESVEVTTVVDVNFTLR
jgi:TonB family protein